MTTRVRVRNGASGACTTKANAGGNILSRIFIAELGNPRLCRGTREVWTVPGIVARLRLTLVPPHPSPLPQGALHPPPMRVVPERNLAGQPLRGFVGGDDALGKL